VTAINYFFLNNKKIFFFFAEENYDVYLRDKAHGARHMKDGDEGSP